MLNVGKGFLGLFIVTVVAGFSFSYAQESGEQLPTGQAIKPKLEFATVEAYSNEIGEAGIMLDREHVRLFAPKTRETEASSIIEYLARAYDELYKIVGVHTQYKIVVYHFPKESLHARGSTSVCVIRYGYENLALEEQEEWKRYGVPHVSGYIEEMAHNFVDSTKANFGWEMVGWSIGAKVSAIVADNPIHSRHVRDTRMKQAKTYRRYKTLRHTFPQDIEPNLADRIHAYLLWQSEKKYGADFWSDVFKEIRKERKALHEAIRLGDGDAVRNERYRVTVECFDRLPGLKFKTLLAENGISTTVAIQSLHPAEAGWNRKFE